MLNRQVEWDYAAVSLAQSHHLGKQSIFEEFPISLWAMAIDAVQPQKRHL